MDVFISICLHDNNKKRAKCVIELSNHYHILPNNQATGACTCIHCTHTPRSKWKITNAMEFFLFVSVSLLLLLFFAILPVFEIIHKQKRLRQTDLFCLLSSAYMQIASGWKNVYDISSYVSHTPIVPYRTLDFCLLITAIMVFN